MSRWIAFSAATRSSRDISDGGASTAAAITTAAVSARTMASTKLAVALTAFKRYFVGAGAGAAATFLPLAAATARSFSALASFLHLAMSAPFMSSHFSLAIS